METKKGFTLAEIIIVLIIVGILAAIAVTNLIVPMEQTRAQTAQNNLLAIATAQQKFYEDYGSTPTPYCVSSGVNPTGLTSQCGDSLIDLNTNLHLNMSGNDTFKYSCSNTTITPYSCTASDGTDTLILNPNNANMQPPQPLISCSGPSSPYCPSVQT